MSIYTWAVNAVLYDLQFVGRISKSQSKEMLAIAGNDINRSYGVGALKTGAATSRFAASAAVFARLVTSAERTPSGNISAQDWSNACRHAFIKAGADEAESYLLVAQLKSFIAES